MNQTTNQVPYKRESRTRKFFRVVFGSMVGFLFTWIIVFILSIVFMVSTLSSLSSSKPVVKENSILKITLPYEIKERAISTPFDDLGLAGYSEANTGLDDIVRCIKAAATDSKIHGIYLNISQLMAAPATIEEIRNALIEFKKSKKFIYAYSEVYSQGAYYLVSVADKIFLNTKGSLDFKGLAVQSLFFKGLLDKLEIEPQIIRHGSFKSAVEPYMLDKMSEANRTQMSVMANSFWNNIITKISDARKVNVDSLNSIADFLKIQTAEDALKHKLVDRLIYQNEVDDIFKKQMGLNEKANVNYISLGDYKNAGLSTPTYYSDKIAVIYAVGEIIDGKGNEEVIGSETLCKEIRNAYKKENIKAIVLRVNSPGGSALASEIIWNEIEQAKKAGKIVITSMGDYAASGGYYISCNSNAIVAQPNTLTGSIGVFGIVPNIQNFMKNKLGVTVDVVKTNQHSDYITPFRKLDAFEIKKLQTDIEIIYEQFTGRVANGRKMEIARVDSIGQGRVWSGSDALRLGLVDKLGNLDDAIKLAAEKAKLTNYNVEYYPKQKDWFSKLIEKKDSDAAITEALKAEMGDLYYTYSSLKKVMNMQGIQARLPMEILFW